MKKRKANHKFDLGKSIIKRVLPGGNRFVMNGNVCKSLHNMALATILLKKRGVREPHWHPNANEMTYCIEGKALISIFSPGNTHDTFTLSKGEVVYFPKGYIHHIENIHSGDSRFLLAYDQHLPEDLDLSESLASMPAHALAATFGTKEEGFQKIKKQAKDTFISQRKTTSKLASLSVSNHNKFDLESIKPQIETKGGSVRIANSLNFPQLEELALFSLRIAKNGIREPHWHPNATELNYVIAGKARLTIFSPGGEKDTFTLLPGQGSVIPTGYFHYIENASSTALHMAVYFNHPTPDDIGLSGALSAFSNEVLDSLFSTDPAFFAKLPKFQEDRMIVSGGG